MTTINPVSTQIPLPQRQFPAFKGGKMAAEFTKKLSSEGLLEQCINDICRYHECPKGQNRDIIKEAIIRDMCSIKELDDTIAKIIAANNAYKAQ